MPRHATYHVQWSAETDRYEIHADQMSAAAPPSPDTRAWFEWLEGIGSFAFSGRAGIRCTLLKERVQRGGSYWYGYRSLHGKTIKRYLGRTQDLSLARLEAVAALLADPSSSPRQGVPRQKKGTALPQSAQTFSFSQRMLEPRSVLLASKLHPPRLPVPLIEREPLFALLGTELPHPLTLLQTPAGFGKTTLVAQWLARGRAAHTFSAVGWVSLDASDNDPLRFWRYVIAACQTSQKSLGEEALALLTSPMTSPVAVPSLGTVLTLLLNDLGQQEHSGLLVLDNYHVIVEATVHETLVFFLDHLPTTFHVVLLSRTEPPFPLLRWRARGELCELHAADLRFSHEETVIFLQQTIQAPLSAEALTLLDASLEGWAAGLRLLSLILQGQRTERDVEALLRSLSTHSAPSESSTPTGPLLNYFVVEILHAQPEPRQRFLLQTSLLKSLNGSLCDAVTGRSDSATLLAEIERAGLFLEALDETDAAGPWYRSHALWAEALRREASRSLGEEALRTLAKRASDWYEQHRMPAEAIDAALLADDAPHAARIIEQSTTDGYQWEPSILYRWLSRLPQEVLSRYPALSLLFALLLRFPQGREDAALPEETWERIEALLQMRTEDWRKQHNLVWLGGLYAIRALSVLPQHPFTRAADYAQQALVWLPKRDSEHEGANRPEIQVWRGVSLFILGLKAIYDGSFGEVKRLLQEAYVCSLAVGGQRFTCETLLLLGESCAARGELHQAAEYYRQAITCAREQENDEGVVGALLGLVRLAFAWNDLARAGQQAHEALELGQRQEQRLSNAALFQIALLDYARGQITTAQQQLATLLVRLQTNSTPWTVFLYYDILIWQGRLQLMTGDLQGAQRSLEGLTGNDQEPPTGQYHVKAMMLRARLLLAQGETQEAQQQLEQCLLVATSQWQVHNSLEIQILLALTYAARQESPQARQQLHQALSQAHSEGLIRLFLSEGEPLIHLLRQLLPALREPALRSFAQSILRAFRSPEGAYATSTGALVEPLSAQEQRVLRLLVAGRSNQEIAQELVVSVNTVKDHLKHLYHKLGVNTRLQASEAAHMLNLL